MVVGGGHHSAHTCRRADLAAKEGAQVLPIETAAELRAHDFRPSRSVGVTAGASTPEWMINRVVDKLESFRQEPGSRLNTWRKHLMGGRPTVGRQSGHGGLKAAERRGGGFARIRGTAGRSQRAGGHSRLLECGGGGGGQTAGLVGGTRGGVALAPQLSSLLGIKAGSGSCRADGTGDA